MRHVSPIYPALGLAVLMTAVLPAQAEDDPRVWLDRMNESVSTMNYRGTFFHFHESRAEPMRILHRVHRGKVTERLIALSGAGREIIRNDDEVTCILPDKKAVLIEQRKRRASLISTLPNYDPSLDRYYDLIKDNGNQVLGRKTVIILVRPLDQYRYGYRLWLDRETAMPLKSQLEDENGGVIEQILFASLSYREITADELKTGIDTASFKEYRSDDRDETAEKTEVAYWRASDAPSGFNLSAARTQRMAGSDYPVEHLVYSDGLASVSVFVEMPQATNKPEVGQSNVGIANAYSVVYDGHLVTAVGEVPRQTVRRIADSVRPIMRDARK